MTTIDEIITQFDLLDDWDDRYRYVVELGRALESFPDELKTEQNRVHGCVSQVWLWTTLQDKDRTPPSLAIRGDSDAYIVRGLVAILLAYCLGKNAAELLQADPGELFERLGLGNHLTPQRSNGFRSMIARIRADAHAALVACDSGPVA
ncbi:SufE family protein [Methylosinus sporium]|uniref:Cysteine desulfuration protein SufE n=1 Tax=Methylosinus sporium TaxID=428 RepID=A0A2U1SMJ3_METSR|nr:SufE family protein [Methylosinus sporium]PWB92833.1 cysteine desulfuration protein SufE [Methylosinus sporium]